MPDITMCRGENCLLKETCYRHKAFPNIYRQSYFLETPLKEDNNCDYYWVIDDIKVYNFDLDAE